MTRNLTASRGFRAVLGRSGSWRGVGKSGITFRLSCCGESLGVSLIPSRLSGAVWGGLAKGMPPKEGDSWSLHCWQQKSKEIA
jgi:hypothetical protein